MERRDGGVGPSGPHDAPDPVSTGAFGPNAWLVEDMYERFRADPKSVPESWREFFADYRPSTPAPAAASADGGEPGRREGPSSGPAPAAVRVPSTVPSAAGASVAGTAPAREVAEP